MQNFPQQFLAALSQKQKSFSGFFIAEMFVKFTAFQKKRECPEMGIKFRAFSNLPQQFQTPLSQKQKKKMSILKKDEYPSLIISEIIDAETRGYLNV